jgi:hypothetical protein
MARELIKGAYSQSNYQKCNQTHLLNHVAGADAPPVGGAARGGRHHRQLAGVLGVRKRHLDADAGDGACGDG